LVDNVLKQKFDLCFTTLNGFDFIWCIKGNETFIYKVATGEMQSKKKHQKLWNFKNNAYLCSRICEKVP